MLEVDGFSEEEIMGMVLDSVVTARCTECGCEREVEPDAENYDCFECDGTETITSPLVKMGLI